MAKKSTASIKENAIKAALELAVEKGWENTSLSDVARRAKIELSELHEIFEDRHDILSAYGRIVDRKVLENIGDPDESLSPRECLFDLLMERYDVLNEDRQAICSILKSFCFDPKQAIISLPHLGRSMSWMLEASNIETSGYKGALKIFGLLAIYLKTLRVWRLDDSNDLAKTMAELDKNLSHAEKWSETLGLSSN